MTAILNPKNLIVMTTNEEQFSKELGERIAHYRKARELTQQQLADALNLKQYAIANYETGRYRVPVAMVAKLADLLGVEVNTLLGLEPTKKKRGPAPKLQQQMERISNLPREQQRSIIQVLDMALKSQVS
jgi:transcriptional regulator with XRE-family HTH domain